MTSAVSVSTATCFSHCIVALELLAPLFLQDGEPGTIHEADRRVDAPEQCDQPRAPGLPRQVQCGQLADEVALAPSVDISTPIASDTALVRANSMWRPFS